MADFVRELAKAIEAKGLTPFAYSKLLGHQSNGMVADVLGRRRDPPPAKLEEWLSVLDLEPAEYDRLYRLALHQYNPQASKLLDELDALRREYEAFLKVFRKFAGLNERFINDDQTMREMDDFIKRFTNPRDPQALRAMRRALLRAMSASDPSLPQETDA